MKTNLKKQEKGFTIIEVLIVLAIAGLIILIVFLAVPALQRNSRNTQRKNDVSALLGGVSEHISNNSGALPAAAQLQATSNVQYYADAPANADGAWNLTPAAGPATQTADRAVVLTGARCTNANTANTGPARGVVVLYGTETSTGTFNSTCQGS